MIGERFIYVTFLFAKHFGKVTSSIFRFFSRFFLLSFGGEREKCISDRAAATSVTLAHLNVGRVMRKVIAY